MWGPLTELVLPSNPYSNSLNQTCDGLTPSQNQIYNQTMDGLAPFSK